MATGIFQVGHGGDIVRSGGPGNGPLFGFKMAVTGIWLAAAAIAAQPSPTPPGPPVPGYEVGRHDDAHITGPGGRQRPRKSHEDDADKSPANREIPFEAHIEIPLLP